MWDVARGVVAREVTLRLGATGAVTGIDLSANMLAVARAAAVQEGLTIEWREGKAEQLPFDDGAFDLVPCQFALIFIADKAAALSEMRRVGAGSGRVLINVWQGLDRHPSYQTLDNVIQQRVGMSAPADLRARQCRRSAGTGTDSRISTSADKAIFPYGTFSKSRSVYCWRNRGRYGRDSFDAASRF